ncbi:hypothetical protein Poli38472_011318 [Pythium oligandrum]|uniref:Long-chain-fatty-acid--CoA ligase n=1 Tax=Pythium oligandrum TaxID=41045 RepID=A0A8K1CRL6_PYTOL|nr:hypothetical protein Poli38472_011318 [Pythium oligandrum]|eukprot:TMW67698.1 hypothetical protein Poli38472_011318 [Pythium oligandrum]
MGGATSTELPMSEIEFESYQGHRYSIEMPNTREATRGPVYMTEMLELDPLKLTLYECLLSGLAMENGSRPLYGTRKIVDGQPGEYEFLTYQQVFDRVEAVAAGLTKFAGVKRQEMVGIFSKNRLEWCVSAHACDRMAYVLVPLYDTLGPEAVPYIVNQTELTTLLCAGELLTKVLSLKEKCPTLKNIVSFDEPTEEQRQLAKQNDLELVSFKDMEALGEQHPIPADPGLADDISTICYTSGTTGNPKGVILLQRNLATIASITEKRLNLNSDIVHISYLPLPHVFERLVIASINRLGGCAGFYRGDIATLMDDVVALKPTQFCAVPRVFNRLYDKITQGVEAAGGVKKLIFDQAYASKKAYLAEGYTTHALWDSIVFAKLREILGGRVNFMLSGSAPLSQEVKEFLKIVFNCDVIEGLGMSETSGGLVVASPEMTLGPHVGAPLPNMLVRLEDVPEMGYSSNDKPRPRGEILCKGPIVFPGYYKNPELTNEAFDADGWFHTGDIGCWNADGTISVIDRKKNIFKLSQGEYVAAEKIENVYFKSKYVAQIFVYGDSFQNALVGIVVPDPEVTVAWGLEHGRSKEDVTVAKVVEDPEFQQEVLDDMTRVGKAAELRGFEFVKKIHIQAEPFGVDEGLVTPTFKLKRPQLKAYFKDRIDALYAQLK